MYNLHSGCSFYNMPNMIHSMDAECAKHDGGNPYCSQGIASLKNGTYVASVSKHGIVHISRSQDGSRAGCLKIPGNTAS